LGQLREPHAVAGHGMRSASFAAIRVKLTFCA
jgi:hypothetical protein